MTNTTNQTDSSATSGGGSGHDPQCYKRGGSCGCGGGCCGKYDRAPAPGVDLTDYSTPTVYSNSAAIAPQAATPLPGGQDERANRAIDFDKLAVLMAHYLAGNVPGDLYWRVDVTAEVLHRAVAVARSSLTQQAAPEAPPDERRNIAKVQRTSDMGLSIRFMSARACSAFERYLAGSK